MDMYEKIDKIRDVVKANDGVKVNKNFYGDYVRKNSLSSGAAQLAESVVGSMWGMCAYGQNNGFKECGGIIDDLSDIVVELTSVGNSDIRRLDKLGQKAKKLMERETKARLDGIDVSDALRDCVESSLEAIEVLNELKKSNAIKLPETQVARLNESAIVLGEIAELLNELGDVTSKAAQAKADAAVGNIRVWREACAAKLITPAQIDKLAAAKKSVEEWSKFTSGVGKRERAKEEHKFKAADELAVIVEGRGALEMLNTFREAMDLAKIEIDELRESIDNNENSNRKQIDKCDEKIAALKKQKADALVAFENGEIDETTAKRTINKSKKEILDVELEKQEAIDMCGSDDFVEHAKMELRQREAVYNRLNTVIRGVEINRGNVAVLADLVFDINFNSLITMLTSGSMMSDKQQAEAASNIDAIVAGLNVKAQNGGKLSEILGVNMRALNKAYNIEQLRDNGVRQRMEERLKRESSESDDEMPDELLEAKKRMASKANEERPKLDVKRITPFGDDDR